MSVSPAGAWIQRHLPDSQLKYLSLSLSMVTALVLFLSESWLAEQLDTCWSDLGGNNHPHIPPPQKKKCLHPPVPSPIYLKTEFGTSTRARPASSIHFLSRKFVGIVTSSSDFFELLWATKKKTHMLWNSIFPLTLPLYKLFIMAVKFITCNSEIILLFWTASVLIIVFILYLHWITKAATRPQM